jgi:hypothetical protein
MFPVNVDGTGTTGGARVVGEGGTARVELAAIAMCQNRLQMQIRSYEEVDEVKMIRDEFAGYTRGSSAKTIDTKPALSP